MVVSQNKGPQYRPPNTIVLTIGTEKRVPLILGNPPYCHVSQPGCPKSYRMATGAKKTAWFRVFGGFGVKVLGFRGYGVSGLGFVVHPA